MESAATGLIPRNAHAYYIVIGGSVKRDFRCHLPVTSAYHYEYQRVKHITYLK